MFSKKSRLQFLRAKFLDRIRCRSATDRQFLIFSFRFLSDSKQNAYTVADKYDLCRCVWTVVSNRRRPAGRQARAGRCLRLILFFSSTIRPAIHCEFVESARLEKNVSVPRFDFYVSRTNRIFPSG